MLLHLPFHLIVSAPQAEGLDDGELHLLSLSSALILSSIYCESSITAQANIKSSTQSIKLVALYHKNNRGG
jgi:hypothetical protein